MLGSAAREYDVDDSGSVQLTPKGEQVQAPLSEEAEMPTAGSAVDPGHVHAGLVEYDVGGVGSVYCTPNASTPMGEKRFLYEAPVR